MREKIPWYLWCAVAAITSAMVGVHWDISWHRSIGRDSFWTPAHVAIYMCGILAGISCGYLILATTFQPGHPLRQASVRIWGFRGPLGAFIAAWGGIAMLTSAPFDDWWHNAYGLDVRIISPPHTVLALGMFGVMLGTVMLVLGWMNRADAGERRKWEWLYLYVAGMALVNVFSFLMETSPRSLQHSAIYYRSLSFGVPFFLVSLGRASGRRWGSTEIAAIYMLFWNIMNWILPLFPAEPKLGPVYNPVKNFVASGYPVLLVIPAFALDLLWPRTVKWPTWRRAIAGGALYLGLLVAVQWNFSMFLQSQWSKNWFFYQNNYDYSARETGYSRRNIYFPAERTSAEFWSRMAVALAGSMAMTGLGLKWSEFLKKVQR